VDPTHRTYGRRVGTHLGRPIWESFRTAEGEYVFDRVAECDAEGHWPLEQLRAGEILVEPGLIYRRRPSRRG